LKQKFHPFHSPVVGCGRADYLSAAMEKTIMKFKDMKIGDRFNYGWLGLVEVVAIHVFGTVDVVNAKGKYYRITGLA
jgi:hypothetical protein